MRRRPGSWSMWLAFRSTATSVCAIVVAVILESTALPTLSGQATEFGLRSPPLTQWLVGMSRWLPMVGVPGLILGIAAIAMRPLRPVLAVLAALASLAAIALIVGTLAVSLMPMYQMPTELGF